MAKFLNLLKLRGFTSPSDAAVEISASTDSASASRLRIDAGGKLTWGDGTNAGDTNLYRSVANTLKTDDYLIAQGGLTVESYQVTTAGASSGTVLKFDGTKFAPGVASAVGALDDLSDVVISSPTTNQALIYNGTQWVNGASGAAGSTYVATIGNGASTTFVVTHGLNTRDVFVQARNANSPYEVIDVQWEATSTSTVTFNFSTPPSSNGVRVAIYSATTGTNIALPLDGLTDVVITSPSQYQILNYDGTNWVNTEASVTTYVRNAEATALQPGEVVYLFGQQGDRASVKRARNTGDVTSATTLGVVAATIPVASDGPVVTQGYLSGLNLAGYTPGGIMYLGSTAGTMTQTKPYAPNHLVYVGVCIRANAGSGIMYVRAQNGYELDELHNVDNTTTPPSSGDVLTYNGIVWVNGKAVLGTNTTGDYVASINSGTGVSVSGASGAGSLPTISIGQAVGTSDSPTFYGLTVGSASVPAFYSSMGSSRVGIGTNMLSASAQVTIKSTSTSYAPLILQNASGQSASSQEWQNASGSVLAYVGSTGDIFSYSSVTGASVSGYTITRGAVLASDADLTLRYTASGTPSQDANINVNRGTSPAVAIRWNETTDKWQFTNDGTTYKDLGSGGITVSDTAPSTPATGDLWYESDTGSTYVYYDSYWIEIGGAAAYNPITGTIQAKGDLLAGTASQTISRLAVGADGTRLAASSSASTGLAWVADTQNTVIDAKGDLLVGTANDTLTRLPVGTNGQMLIADSSQTAGVGWSDVNNRNLVYNGAMQVAQRSTSVAGITADSYNTADRWSVGISNLGTWTQSVESHTSPTDDIVLRQGFRKSLKMLCTTAKASPTTSDEAGIVYKFEGQDLQSIAKGTSSAKSLTLSFWVKSNVTGTYIVELMDDDNSNRHVNKAYTISASATWEYKTITFPPDTTGLFDNDNAQSMRLHFWFATGSNYNTGSLQTSWGALNQTGRAVGQVNLASAINNYYQITGIQFNVGTVAAPFEFKSYERDLRECQRYYWRKTSAVNYQAIGFGMADSTTGAQITIPYPVPMRDAPSSFDWNALRLCDYQNVVSPTSWAIVGYRTSPTVATMAVYTAGSLVQYRPYILEGNNTSTAFFGMSAEL